MLHYHVSSKNLKKQLYIFGYSIYLIIFTYYINITDRFDHWIQPYIEILLYYKQNNSYIPIFSSNYAFSIVITTYNRFNCMKRVFDRIYKYKPSNTEVIIVDDHSTQKEYINFYKNAKKYEDLTIYKNDFTRGAFYSKLYGFRHAKGKFIMSCDDDDLPDPDYFSEMSANVDDAYDLILAKNGIYIDLEESDKNLSILISKYHNHVNMAIKSTIIKNIQYPFNMELIRDDAPIIIPLYLNTKEEKIKFYKNHAKYRLDSYCGMTYSISRQMLKYYQKKRVFNGYKFLIDYAKHLKLEKYIPSIRIAYRKILNDKYLRY